METNVSGLQYEAILKSFFMFLLQIEFTINNTNSSKYVYHK